jgi:hypothetical protein
LEAVAHVEGAPDDDPVVEIRLAHLVFDGDGELGTGCFKAVLLL